MSKNPSLTRLFVYGSLLPGLEGARHRVPDSLELMLSRLERVGLARICGILFDLGQYPGLVLNPEKLKGGVPEGRRARHEHGWAQAVERTEMEGREVSGFVHGELFDFNSNPSVLKQIDDYEGYDFETGTGLFERVEAEVEIEGRGEEVLAWTYVFPKVGASAWIVAGGDYRKYLTNRWINRRK